MTKAIKLTIEKKKEKKSVNLRLAYQEDGSELRQPGSIVLNRIFWTHGPWLFNLNLNLALVESCPLYQLKCDIYIYI
jgi:hypothetical protein